jgi:hypothetical protein
MKRKDIFSRLVFLLLVLSMSSFFGCSKEPGVSPLGEKEKVPLGFTCTYSADFVQRMYADGRWQTVAEGKVWENCCINKMEMNLVAEGMPQPVTFIMINRPDLDVSWRLFPKSKKYIEERYGEDEGFGDAPAIPSEYGVDIQYEKVDSEVVNGYPCDKYRVTLTDPGSDPYTFYGWAATDLDNIFIKKEFSAQDGTIITWELFNIVLGTPPKELFEIPAGYTKASESEASMLMMKEVMGDAFPGGIPIPPMGQE